MTKRKSLGWYRVGEGRTEVPGCDKCADLLFMPGFTEAVYSVSIEHSGNPAELARRTITEYHERRHPAAEWGLAS